MVDVPSPARPLYRLWVNDTRTVLVRLWEDGTCEASFRMTPDEPPQWGPPIPLTEEKVR